MKSTKHPSPQPGPQQWGPWHHSTMPFSFSPPPNPRGHSRSPQLWPSLPDWGGRWKWKDGKYRGEPPLAGEEGEKEEVESSLLLGLSERDSSRRGASRSAPQPRTSHFEPSPVRSPTPTSTRSPSPGGGQFIPEAQPLPAPLLQPEHSPTTAQTRSPAPTFPCGHPFD